MISWGRQRARHWQVKRSIGLCLVLFSLPRPCQSGVEVKAIDREAKHRSSGHMPGYLRPDQKIEHLAAMNDAAYRQRNRFVLPTGGTQVARLRRLSLKRDYERDFRLLCHARQTDDRIAIVWRVTILNNADP